MSRIVAIVAVALLASCAVGPDYERPVVKTPQQWGEKAETAPADLSAWWTIFRDETLNRLVDRAVQSNHDLKIAAARVAESRAEQGIVMSAFFPEVDAIGSHAHSRLSPNAQPFTLTQTYQSRYHIGFDASWEIDLFGGVQRGYEAAAADHESWIENRRAVLVTLLGEVARNYVAYRGSQLNRRVLRENAATARETAEIVRARLAAGVATTLDLARAESQLASTEAALPPAEVLLKQFANRLAVLTGEQPGALAAELAADAPIPSASERVIIGLPSDLILRRPDVRQAERQLASQTARIGVAVAEQYPKISLTGAFGLDSLGSADLFKWSSRAWSVGPSIRWPIFAGGRLRAQIAVEDARKEQVLASYEKSVLTALEDVENALVSYLREGERLQSLIEAAKADRRAVDLAEDLYKKGLTSFLDVLDAQRTLYATELSLGRSTADVTLNLVALYKALGGGWETKDR